MNRTQMKRGLAIATSIVLGGALAMTGVSPALASGTRGAATAGSELNSLALRTAITADGLTRHLDALQSIAVKNGGNRAAGTPGHEASGAYVEKQLAQAGYKTVPAVLQLRAVRAERLRLRVDCSDRHRSSPPTSSRR